MSLRTPLGRALNQGAAREGAVSHWIVERVTGLALAPLSIWLLVQLLLLPTWDYAAVADWIAAGWNPVWLTLTVLLAAWHSWQGLQVVIADYVHGFAIKTVSLLLSAFAHALVAASGVYAVLHVAFRSAG
jgi:succinate dehydrogenase / fumarate reductase membrane anchor subunit